MKSYINRNPGRLGVSRLDAQITVEEVHIDQNKALTDKHTATVGFKKLFDPHYKIWQKSLWFLTLIFSTGALTYQVVDRIRYYESEPTASQITLTENQTIVLPYISLCIDHDESYRLLSKAFTAAVCEKREKKNCGNELNVSNITFKSMNVTMLDFVPYLRADSGMVYSLNSKCTEVIKNCQQHFPFAVESHRFIKSWGNCTTVRFDEPIEYKHGNKLKIGFSIDEMSSAKEINTIDFFFHRTKIWPTIDEVYEFKPIKGDTFSYEFNVNQFSFVNTKKKPCVDSSKFVDNKNNCFTSIVLKNITCSIPHLIKDGVTECNSLAEIEANIRIINEGFNSKSSKGCQVGNKMCHEILYGMRSGAFVRPGSSDNYSTTPRGSSFTPVIEIVFHNNVFQRMEEVSTYSFTALVSDLSGNAGFFLGICLLSFVEFIENLAVVVMARLG